MTTKNNLIIYNNFIEPIKLLSNEDAGILFKKLVAYHFDNTETQDNAFVEFAFGMMKPLIDSNKETYDNICKRNSENGSKGGRPKGSTKTQKTQSVNLETQKNPKKLNRIEKNIKEDNKDILDKKDFISFWNGLADKTSLPTLKALTDDRVKHIKARCKDYNFNIEEFKSELSSKILASAFLRNETEWNKLSFDWIVKPNNFVKVIEGKYQDKNAVVEQNTITQDEELERVKKLEELKARRAREKQNANI